MTSLRNRFKRKITSVLSSAFSRDEILTRLAEIERKIERLEIFEHGAPATYVGNNRVLTRAIIANNRIAFLVEADDRLLSPWFIVSGGYETPLTNYFVSTLQPDSHCLDIGTNFGFFTCLMARFCPNGRVIGVEPDEHVFELARDNILINGFSHAEVLHGAAGKDSGELTLYRRHTRSGNTSITKAPDTLIKILGEQPSQPFKVRSFRVDDLLKKMNGRVDFIKIDVEGAEPLVFEGVQDTVAKNSHITFVVEWSPGQITQAGFDISTFIARVEALGLRPFDIIPGGFQELSFAELAQLPYRAGIVLKKNP